MIINPEGFKPKEKGKSDFFSWNLYRWLRKNKGKECSIFLTPREYTPYVIGYKDSNGNIIGFRLKELCTTASDRKFPRKFCYGDTGWPDVTEEFYKEYARIGVCHIHGDSAHEFTYIGGGLDQRMCKYCGKIEKKVITLVERVSWEAVL